MGEQFPIFTGGGRWFQGPANDGEQKEKQDSREKKGGFVTWGAELHDGLE